MAKYKFEYVWLDGYKPMPHIRSKTAIKELKSFDGKADSLPEWSFDGSSTHQAEGHFSDCILKPARVYPDPARENGYVVLCEVLNADHSPHSTNARATIEDGELDPKPIKGNWNGSGMHSNFSTTYTRETGGEAYINALLEGFAPHHAEHMAEYGAHNEERMTGAHENATR